MNGNGNGFAHVLTDEEIRALFRRPFYDPASPLIMQQPSDVSVLDASPFFLTVETLLKTVQREGSVKLTQRGYLPPKLCREIYNHRHLPDSFVDIGVVKITTERVAGFIHTARIISGIAGFIKVRHNKLSLTKRGTGLLFPENRFKLFRAVFDIYTERFNWGYNDRYTDAPVGQYGFGFTLLLLKEFGNESREALFYADIFRSTVSAVIDFFDEECDRREKEKLFIDCYCLRSFERFTHIFGLTEIVKEAPFIDSPKDQIRTTKLFHSVIAKRTRSG
jgi:hypothetical protein